MQRLLCSWCVAVCLAAGAAIMLAQEPSQKKEETKPETFFAGTVAEFTFEKITISRVVLGKTEKRTFRITQDTKTEGKVKAKVRVTVRYVITEEGETAELIVVRAADSKKKQP